MIFQLIFFFFFPLLKTTINTTPDFLYSLLQNLTNYTIPYNTPIIP